MSTVTRHWTWLEGSTPMGEPRCEVEMRDPRQAEAFVDDCIEDLVCAGFSERGREAEVLQIRERALRPHPPTEAHRRIARDIVSHCGKRGWFGADMRLRWFKAGRRG